MKLSRPCSAVRRDMFVEMVATTCCSSVGAAYFHAAPDGAGESFDWHYYKHVAPTALPLKRIRLVSPLAEQKRIVARVEELVRWCDTLEAQLHQTRTLGAYLLASILHHLLAA